MDCPHTITVFGRMKNNQYPRKVVDSVFWYGSQGLAVSGKGLVSKDSINVLIPLESVPDNFEIEKGSRIVKGSVPEIEKLSELDGCDHMFMVDSVSEYSCGSLLDCILVSGK